MVPAVAANVADVAPEATVTDAGTESRVLLLDNETAVALVVAWVKVTVQVDVPPELRLVGLHEMELKATGASNEIVAVCELPFSVAVTTAL